MEAFYSTSQDTVSWNNTTSASLIGGVERAAKGAALSTKKVVSLVDKKIRHILIE